MRGSLVSIYSTVYGALRQVLKMLYAKDQDEKDFKGLESVISSC